MLWSQFRIRDKGDIVIYLECVRKNIYILLLRVNRAVTEGIFQSVGGVNFLLNKKDQGGDLLPLN